ncbi:hypothetical protein ABZ916_39135 [Streptomyces sp. NPDC046853]|uniref:hypothetical protein n=1 Tax=Streptomyces sp. NPDC046853 TaxID=3154920 RepID=UPI0033CB07D7
MFNQSVTRVRAGEKTDRGGNTVKDWSPGGVQRLPVAALNIQPAVQSESVDEQRNQVITGYRVQSAEGTAPDIRAVDRIEWRGETYEVEGEVAEWPELFVDAVHHIEFTMRRTTG